MDIGQCRVHCEIRFEANIKRRFIRFETNKTGFYSFASHQSKTANLHAKRIKTRANIPLSANIYLFRIKANILEQNEVYILKKN